jgi:hypothetical protein
MAKFKVGQRVRVIGHFGGSRIPREKRWIGHEGTIIARPWHGILSGWNWYLDLNGFRYYFHDAELAPLTDPKADAFLESIRKLKPLYEPQVGDLTQPQGEKTYSQHFADVWREFTGRT